MGINKFLVREKQRKLRLVQARNSSNSMADDKQDKVEIGTLEGSQLAYARELLDELHPVEDTPLCVAFPWLGVFTKCGVPEYPKYRNRPDEGALGDQTQEPLLQEEK